MLIGDLLARSESTVHYVGAGRRASTIKVRIGALRGFLEWLKTWYGLRSFTQQEHLLDYLREVVIEGRARGAVKRVKAALALAVHVACIRLASLQIRNTLFISMRTGILNSVRVGAPPSPAPRPLLILFWALGDFVCDFDGPGRRYGTTTISERIRAGWSSIPIAFVELGLLDEWRPHGGAAHVRLVRCRVGRCLAQIRRAIDGGEPKIVEEDESLPDLEVRSRGAQPVAAAVAAPAPLAAPVQSASDGILADMRFLLEEFAGLERCRTHMRDDPKLLHPGPHFAQSRVPRLGGDQQVGRRTSFGCLPVHSLWRDLEMPQRDFLIYVEALSSAKGLVVVDESVSGGTLLEAIVEQMEEGGLYPDQLTDVISRAKVWSRRQDATAADAAALVEALSKYPEVSSHALNSDDGILALPPALCDDDGGGVHLLALRVLPRSFRCLCRWGAPRGDFDLFYKRCGPRTTKGRTSGRLVPLGLEWWFRV